MSSLSPTALGSPGSTRARARSSTEPTTAQDQLASDASISDITTATAPLSVGASQDQGDLRAVEGEHGAPGSTALQSPVRPLAATSATSATPTIASSSQDFVKAAIDLRGICLAAGVIPDLVGMLAHHGLLERVAASSPIRSPNVKSHGAAVGVEPPGNLATPAAVSSVRRDEDSSSGTSSRPPSGKRKHLQDEEEEEPATEPQRNYPNVDEAGREQCRDCGSKDRFPSWRYWRKSEFGKDFRLCNRCGGRYGARVKKHSRGASTSVPGASVASSSSALGSLSFPPEVGSEVSNHAARASGQGEDVAEDLQNDRDSGDNSTPVGAGGASVARYEGPAAIPESSTDEVSQRAALAQVRTPAVRAVGIPNPRRVQPPRTAGKR
ncbi:hypothetical protein CF319_g7084 [Tilletia indica]|nr:hypothetical protein CF319_g7084 [Tilletia indica]